VVSSRAAGFFGWTRVATVVVVGGAAVALVGAVESRSTQRTAAIAGIALAGLLVAPTAWASSEATHRPANTTLPQAGPRQGLSSTSFGSVASDGDPDLARFLRRHAHGETWDLATVNARQASGLIAYDHLSVMALGGFMGTDPAADVARVADLVARREVRYFAPTPLTPAQIRRDQAAGRLGPLAPGVVPVVHSNHTRAGRIMLAVLRACRPVHLPPSLVPHHPDGEEVGPLWDCRGRAAALRGAMPPPADPVGGSR
jgi:hypothetical protein